MTATEYDPQTDAPAPCDLARWLAEAQADMPESPPPTDAEIEDMARLFGLAGGDAADPFA